MREETPNNLLYFECTGCGDCCRWQGDVCVEPEEIEHIARFLDMSNERFIAEYCRLRANRQGLSIRDNENGACSMLTENNLCRIHEVKPQQCKGFPNRWNFPGWQELCPAKKMQKGI